MKMGIPGGSAPPGIPVNEIVRGIWSGRILKMLPAGKLLYLVQHF